MVPVAVNRATSLRWCYPLQHAVRWSLNVFDPNPEPRIPNR